MQKTTETKVTHQLYPTAREDYTYRVGAFAEFIITLILELSGFVVESHEVNAKGADIILLKQNVGIEVWNHCKAHNYKKKIKAVIKNLKPFKYKFLIASFISRKTKARLEAEGITVIVLGYQLLPSDYLPYYNQTKDTHGKKFGYLRMIDLLANQLKPLINEIKNQTTANTIKTKGTNVFSRYRITLNDIINTKIEKMNKSINKFTSKKLRIRLINNNFKHFASVKDRLHIPQMEALSANSVSILNQGKLYNKSRIKNGYAIALLSIHSKTNKHLTTLSSEQC
jgi:hypothetical protein